VNHFRSSQTEDIEFQKVTAEKLPHWPQTWYVVGRSSDLKRGSTQAVELAGKQVVLYRTENGVLNALDGICPHMGAHLSHGDIVGEDIRCALHHWRFGLNGKIMEGKSACPSLKRWEVCERFGLVFIFLGESEGNPLPSPSKPDQYVWTTSNPIELNADWRNMVINGFDMPHLNAVHHRQLIAPAEFEVLDGNRFRLNYVSSVTGNSLSDSLMKWVSGNEIHVTQTCYGPTVIVETNLGHTKTSAVLSILKTNSGVRAFSAFGIQPKFLISIRLLITRLLFTAFLKRDFKVLQGMQLNIDVEDPGVRAFTRFLSSLPDFEN